MFGLYFSYLSKNKRRNWHQPSKLHIQNHRERAAAWKRPKTPLSKTFLTCHGKTVLPRKAEILHTQEVTGIMIAFFSFFLLGGCGGRFQLWGTSWLQIGKNHQWILVGGQSKLEKQTSETQLVQFTTKNTPWAFQSKSGQTLTSVTHLLLIHITFSPTDDVQFQHLNPFSFFFHTWWPITQKNLFNHGRGSLLRALDEHWITLIYVGNWNQWLL